MSRKRTVSMKAVLCLLVLPVMLTYPRLANAQVSHNAKVTVSAITVISVTAASVNLTITGANAVAGQDQMTAVDQSTSLLWGVNTTPKKITCVSNLAAPKFTIKLLALNPTQGAAATALTLDNTAADLVTNIGLTKGSCVLQYTATVLASQGTGSDNHTLTFTIATQ